MPAHLECLKCRFDPQKKRLVIEGDTIYPITRAALGFSIDRTVDLLSVDGSAMNQRVIQKTSSSGRTGPTGNLVSGEPIDATVPWSCAWAPHGTNSVTIPARPIRKARLVSTSTLPVRDDSSSFTKRVRRSHSREPTIGSHCHKPPDTGWINGNNIRDLVSSIDALSEN